MKYLQSALFLLALLSGAVSAHTALSESIPADGAELENTPQALSLRFTESVRLLRAEVFAVLDSQEQKIDIGFDPNTTSANQYAVPLPALTNGHYRAKWVVMGADGHPVEGVLVFSVGVTEHHAEHLESADHQSHADTSAAHSHAAH
ncbi:MAG: hypothetical protein COB20_09325 [SAR86 cluster bacterium]|uniref:Copper resistance protein C n=1 Tax=SAR86 cluster bacterium TaxID=2030880 RepID=A0A2A4X2V0_9GAMM|nr:MAG: hypothetical protein COB20_09325 [SAR86 cluster bacterium]